MNYNKNIALVLLTTQKEYLSGMTHNCLDKYFNNQVSKDKKIDILIFFNKGEEFEYLSLLDYEQKENVNSVKIHSHKLSDFDDLYARTPEEFKSLNLEKIPDLGGSAGPNNLFFKSMMPLCQSDYDYLLMIETDSQPIQDMWIDKILDFCAKNKFLVAGSIYKGKMDIPDLEPWAGHLNGIAIYRKSVALNFLLKQSQKLIKARVLSRKNCFISFDVGMHSFRGTFFGRKYYDDRSSPENHLINCSIISNYSLPIDSDTSIECVKKENPQTIILHKK